MYYRSADVAILCFDLTNRESFLAMEKWTSELTEKAPENLKSVIVGTKKDLNEKRVVSVDEGKDFTFSNNARFYFETSAKTGEGILELFTEIANMGEPDKSKINENEIIEIQKQQPVSKPNSGGCC